MNVLYTDGVECDIKTLCQKIIDNSKDLSNRIRYLELPKACPFFFAFERHIDCPYLKEDKTCQDSTRPGNTAAWCHKLIKQGIKSKIAQGINKYFGELLNEVHIL